MSTNNTMASNENSFSKADLIFWITAGLVLFSALGVRHLWGSEDRWAEIAREMLLTKDFLHPTRNWMPYFDKPLLSYWFIVLIGLVTGVNEFVSRMPSAIAALVTLASTMYIGKKLWSATTARLACWMLLSCYGFIFWSRTASADVENVAAITLAVAWFWAYEKKFSFWSYLVLCLICFLGAHTKGLLSIVIPPLVMFPYIIRDKRWLKHLRVSLFAASAVAVIIYFIPFVLATMTRADYQDSGLGLVFRENIERFYNPYDHKNPFYIYIYETPLLFLPWAPLLVGAIATIVKRFKSLDLHTRWCLEGTALIYLFFSVSSSRRGYYILPILPFLALLTAVLIVEYKENEKLKNFMIALMKYGFIAISVVEVLFPIVWLALRGLFSFTMPTPFMIATPLLGIASLCVFFISKRSPTYWPERLKLPAKYAAPILSGTILIGGLLAFQVNSFNVYSSEKAFAMDLKKLCEDVPYENQGFFIKVPSSLIFYMKTQKPVMFLYTEETTPKKIMSKLPLRQRLEEFLASPAKKKTIVVERRYAKYIKPHMKKEIFDNPTLVEKSYPMENKKALKNKFVVWKIVDGKVVATQ